MKVETKAGATLKAERTPRAKRKAARKNVQVKSEVKAEVKAAEQTDITKGLSKGQLLERIAELKADIKRNNTKLAIFKAEVGVEPTAEHILARREFSKSAYDQLLGLSQTSKIVISMLKLAGVEGFKTFLSPSQLPKFKEEQYNHLFKSVATVKKMMSDGEKFRYVKDSGEDGEKITPLAYLGLIIKGSVLIESTFKKRRAAKFNA